MPRGGSNYKSKGVSDLLEDYEHTAEKYPITKGVVDLLPGVGTAAAMADTAASLSKGHYGTAALDSLGVIPVAGPLLKKARLAGNVIKDVKEAGALDRGLERADQAARGRAVYTAAERSLPTGVNGDMQVAENEYFDRPLKKGGKVTSKKRVVFSASKRGDGIAQRGKTRGKMR